jgi:hypothetical protein
LGAIGQYSKEKSITGTYQIILGTGEESRIPILEKLGEKKVVLPHNIVKIFKIVKIRD